jgi:phage tail-like protein
MIDNKRLSRYLDDLPAIFRQEATEGGPDFLGLFLLAFEHVLTGVGDPADPGLEEILEGIVAEDGKVEMAGAHRYFTPGPDHGDLKRTPEEFLEWLSGWVALTLRDDWNAEERRRILAEVVPSYSQRGTPGGLRQIVAAFAGVHPAAIKITDQPFQVGRISTIGEDTVLGVERPHFFVVSALIPGATDLARRRMALRAIIDREKPAHTCYNLFVQTSTMRIGVSSIVGVNTVLGIPIETP